MFSSFWGVHTAETTTTNTTVTTVMHHDHTPGCKLLGEYRLMAELDILEQDAVLSCPHRSHDAVKVLFKVTCNSQPSTEPEEGRLF